MREAGADTVAFGLESGSPAVLKSTNKRIVLEQVSENIKAAQEFGMDTELFTIFGLPGETVDEARATLDFVRSLEVPIQSNSGSQQMQLYFGSVYAKNPDRFGFKPLPGYRPLYQSIGDTYETDAMSAAGIRRVRNMWALANEQMERDVYFKQRLFEVIDFLLGNHEDLKEDPRFHAYGALASSALEEFDLLERFLEDFQKIGDDNGDGVRELISGLSFFRESDGPAESHDRVIFGSRSWMDGVPFTGISGKFWDVLLGRGLLLESFEEGFEGARRDQEITFDFTFPDDYVQEELRGKTVEVHAKVHKIFKPVEAETLEDVRNLGIRNNYDFSDLDTLQDQNEILYYLALRDADPGNLLRTPSHFLSLVHKLAKLGKRETVDAMARMVQGNAAATGAVADTLSAAGKCSWAMKYYDALSEAGHSSITKRAMCLLAIDKPGEALDLLLTVPEDGSLEFQRTLLECLKRADPESRRIPSLSHHVLNLRVQAALDREKISRLGAAYPGPVVHGAPSDE
jgi:hypothetical protein